MGIEASLTFFVAIFIFSVTPGPGVFAILAKSLSQGVMRTLPFSIGMACGDIVYLVLACFGLSAIAMQFEEVFLAIRYAGAAYLIYLGYKMWVAPVNISEPGKAVKVKGEGIAAAVQGFMISSSNPKVVLFYIAFLPTFMDVTALQGYDIVYASLVAFSALVLGLTLVSLGAARAGKMIKSERALKRMNRGAGGIMLGAGAYLALSK